MKEERSFNPGELDRIGVSLPANLLDKFDGIIKTRGYSSRSEGIRDAIRAYIIEYEQMGYESGEEIGVITYIYDHSQRRIGEELLNRQYHHRDVIRTVMRIHLDEVDCVETIVVKGKTEEIKKLAGDIMSLRGVKNLKWSGTLLSAIGGGL